MVASKNRKFGLLGWAGFTLMIFGITLTTMMIVNYLEQEPRGPLGFDLTLRQGYGGFIAYGVAAAILGFALVCKAKPVNPPG